MSFIDKYYAIFNNSVGQHSVTISRTEFANLLGVFSKNVQQLDQLKAELQEYQDWLDEFKLMFRYDDREPDDNSELYSCLEHVFDENKKLKQTINEIKEILKKVYNDCDDCYRDVDTNCDIDCIDCTLGGQAKLAEQILERINEVEK